MDLPARPGPDPSANTFRAFKVDNAAIDCTWVNANKPSKGVCAQLTKSAAHPEAWAPPA